MTLKPKPTQPLLRSTTTIMVETNIKELIGYIAPLNND
jgi:hypothetical protein